MSFLTLALAALFSSGPAHAISNELTIDYGWQGAHDDSWDLISDNPRIGSYGARAGLRLSDRLGVVGSWGRGARGAEIYVEDADTYEELGSFQLAFKMQQVGVGVKADLDVNPYVRPYAVLMGTGMLGSLWLDDDPEEDDNANQTVYRGFGPGGFVGLGSEFMSGMPDQRVRVVGTLEAGYSHTFPMAFKSTDEKDQVGSVPIGDLGFNGLTIRLGAGLRF